MCVCVCVVLIRRKIQYCLVKVIRSPSDYPNFHTLLFGINLLSNLIVVNKIYLDAVTEKHSVVQSS